MGARADSQNATFHTINFKQCPLSNQLNPSAIEDKARSRLFGRLAWVCIDHLDGGMRLLNMSRVGLLFPTHTYIYAQADFLCMFLSLSTRNVDSIM